MRTRFDSGGHSRKTQYAVAAETLECGQRFAVAVLGSRHERGEGAFLAQRVEPRIAGHGGETEESAGDYALQKLERRLDLVQVRQVARQVEQPFGIAEIRPDDPSDGDDALRDLALDQRSGRDDEVAKAGWHLAFELAKVGKDLVAAPELCERNGEHVR